MVAPEDELIFVEISQLDFMLIERVKALRIASKMTQLQLTQKMKLADGFISKVETFTERAKYSIRHINLLASALNCTIQDILPLEQPKYDMVIVTLRRTNKINKDGSLSQKKTTEVIKIEPKEKS
ncbi:MULTISPECIES: helix-turn-helix domain-containing protein [Pedobacter]|uniref:XRE family transcriptional regulator n=2 Tax=Pedobacter TaxID=84567 RepID=A0A369PPZ6_9SPHI|nr:MULTISPECIES: helix-turn-helix transcriptional regulator [Pedobacter]MCZ4224703.1 helix-turn-helix transcriptional regulator [Pedobacter sp. SJ11]RDC54603.1 XRE family transcriptional regulator [Pedobacter chinensis]